MAGSHGTGKMGKKIPCQGKHRELGHFAKTQGIFVCLSPNFIDFEDQGYCSICREIHQFFRMCLQSQFCT